MALIEEKADLYGKLKRGSEEQLAALIRIAMGNDKLDEFVEKTGLSKGMLSKLMNMKATNPRRSTLEKIAKANNNGVRLNDLLRSAGMPEDERYAPGLEILSEVELEKLRHKVEVRNFATKQTALIVAQNYLISRGNTSFVSKYDDGNFSIKVDDKELIGIPVVESGKELGEIAGEVFGNILRITKEKKEKIQQILIVTCFGEVYDHFVSAFSDFPTQEKPIILYTSDNMAVAKCSE